MKCPVCDSRIEMDDRFCVSCGSFLKGRRPGTKPGDRVDLNNDSLEVISQLPGVSREQAVIIVRERRRRQGFMNVTEVVGLLQLSALEAAGLEKLSTCSAAARADRPPATPEPHKNLATLDSSDPPPEWDAIMERQQRKRTDVTIKEETSVETVETRKVDINNDPEEDIAALPSLNIAIAKRISREREARGGFNSVDELAKAVRLKSYNVELISPLIEFRPLKTKSKYKHKGRIVDY